MRTDYLKLAFSLAAASCLSLLMPSFGSAQDDESVEGLYQTAVQLNMDGKAEEASATFEKLFAKTKGIELLFEDYGAQAGGLLFDYGMTLLPQQRWEEAKKAFMDCINGAQMAEDVESPVKSTNPRETIAKFQLGFCEAQLGNHEEAIKLYEEYLEANPPQSELAQVRNSFKLRYGGSLMKIGEVAEGVAAIQELFDNREAWKVSPQFLMQGVLELGTAWAEQAIAAAAVGDEARHDEISDRGHDFLDKNGELIHLAPMDQFRFGYVDRLRMLGFEATRAGLYTLALRYFSYIPTIQNIREDIMLAVGRQPIGSGIPSQFQSLLEQLDEREKAPLHPDAEMLRLVANCYERIGNVHAPRVIYWHLSEQFPEMPSEVRAEVLHEAARLSSIVGDYPGAQYFGEKFAADMPDDHPLRNNVSTFMLQSLFTSRGYEEVIRIAERVRERFPEGDPQRELADSLYPLALYSLKRHEEAAEPFAEYVKAFPGGGNREIAVYHRASNSLVLRKMREAAEQYEDFLKEFPESERFLDNALADLAIARFNLEDYPAAIAAVDRLVEERPDSIQVGRTQNIRGDAYIIQSGKLSKEQQEQALEWRQAALAAYLAAVEGGKAAMAKDPDRADFHREAAAEGLWKSADLYYEDGEIEKGLVQYDAFVAEFSGTFYDPQISVFSLEHLESAGRGEEALQQVEKTILFLGSRPSQEQDLTLLRQAIGSYAEASVRIRGLEPTIATLDSFPGMEPTNQALLTWLKIQKVIVLQESRKGKDRESAEYAAVEARIAEVFEELRLFEKRNLSEFALQQIGIHFAGTDNPFLGVPYFEELLARQNPEAEAFKAPAEMELGKIEMRAAEPAKVQSARERFRRIVTANNEDSRPLEAQAYLNLADLHIRSKEWRDALEALDKINKEKRYFANQRDKRAEAAFKMGTVLDELKDAVGANQAYLSVVSTYGAYYDWVTQAWERYIPNSIADFEKMPVGTLEEQAQKRQRQLALYKLTLKFLYQWQNLSDDDSPSGALRRLRRDISEMKDNLRVTPEEESAIFSELGIPPQS